MFLAIRELLHAKFRYLLIGFIIVLISGLIFIISGLAKGLSADNASAIQNLQADYLVLEEGVEQQLTKSSISGSAADQIAETEGVTEAVPLSIRMAAAAVNDKDQKADVALFGTDMNGTLLPNVTEGNPPAKSNEVVVDASLKKEGLRIGDALSFAGNDKEYTIVGFAENQRFSHTSVVYMNGSTDKVNAFAIQTNGEISDELSKKYDVLTKEEVLQGIPSYSQEQASLNMMIIFLYVIAAFVLAVFFYVMTLQKKSQFGVLKALGSNTSYLIRNLVSQVAVISIVCILIAVGLSFGVKELLPPDMPFILESQNMLQSAVLLLAVSVVGSLLSLVQVVNVDPIEAIEGAE
ncbi:ABC transporter permease [Virgibacillus doumboii]|uniref:ABC transporter permease n=1 Tax=Virgibacillus doumboii TaxID=2697503 RepID=UPI0013E0345C|nr:ABC transporter permease [Virgibacillus doumboii]